MIRWWRTGWAPIQRALYEQRRRDEWHLFVAPRLAAMNQAMPSTADAIEGIRRFGEFLHQHPELIEDP